MPQKLQVNLGAATQSGHKNSCVVLAVDVFSRYTVDKHSYQISMKLGRPPLQSTRVLDQVRERIRYLHYSFSTEKNYLDWVRFFICWRGPAGKMLHPVGMGAAQVEAFITIFTAERKVPASTHNQIFSALGFLYHFVLAMDLSRMGNAKISPVGAGDTPLSYSHRFPNTRSTAGKALWNT